MRDGGPLALLLVIVAAAPLALAAVDFGLARGNRSLQQEVNRRQLLIDRTTQLARVNELFIRHIAITAIGTKDAKLRELLTRNGVTINIAPAAQAVPPANGKTP